MAYRNVDGTHPLTSKQEQRAIKLLSILRSEHRLDVKSAADALSISEATVRRLFSRLEGEGKAIRVHGGIQLIPQVGYDYSFRLSAGVRNKEKTDIGNAAADLVEDGDRVFLDSGTTVLKLAEELAIRLQTARLHRVVVTTNSLNYVESLARWCKVIIVGGEIRVERRDVCGVVAEKNLSMFHVDKAFFGADAVNGKEGFMTTDEMTATMNDTVLQHAAAAYVLADSTKFDNSSFVSYAELSQITSILTDNELGPDVLERFSAAGARIRIV